MRGDCNRSIGSPHVTPGVTCYGNDNLPIPPTFNEGDVDQSDELPTPSWRLWVARPDPSFRELKSLSATGLEPPVQQRKAIVSSLIGERLQIPATAPVVERQPGEGAGVGQRGESEGSRRALRPVPLLSRGLYPFARAWGVLQNWRGVSRSGGCSAGPACADELEHK
jgi:hypothetical protein